MRTRLKYLIVAAYQKELIFLKDMGRKYLLIDGDIGYLAAGIGPVAATFGLTHCLEDYSPELMIAIGTAGIINPKFKIGDIVRASSCSTQSKSPDTHAVAKIKPIEFSEQNLDLKRHLKTLKTLPQTRAYCPQEITKTSHLMDHLTKASHDIENLEAYAYAFVAKRLKVPTLCLMGLTNHVGQKAHEQWVKNEGKVCKKLAEHVKAIIKTA